MGNLTFDGVDSKMLHLGDEAGPELGDAIRLELIKPISKRNNKIRLDIKPISKKND